MSCSDFLIFLFYLIQLEKVVLVQILWSACALGSLGLCGGVSRFPEEQGTREPRIPQYDVTPAFRIAGFVQWLVGEFHLYILRLSKGDTMLGKSSTPHFNLRT